MILLKTIFLLIGLYGLIGVVVNFANKKMRNSFRLPLPRVALPIGIVGVVLTSLLVVVGAQDVGVRITPQGVSSDELTTGWHVIMPWDDVEFMDKTTWVYTCANGSGEGTKNIDDAIWAPSSEGIKLGYDVSVSWKINPKEASWVYSEISENDDREYGRYLWIEENVIRTKLKSALALVASEYTPTEAYSFKRKEIQEKVFQKMKSDCKDYRLIISQVDIREVYYPKKYEEAINDKKLAEQTYLKLKEVTKQENEKLKQSEIKKNQKIQEAEGRAEALRIEGEAIRRNPKIVQLRQIEKWDGKYPNYYMVMGGNKGQMPIIEIPAPQSK